MIWGVYARPRTVIIPSSEGLPPPPHTQNATSVDPIHLFLDLWIQSGEGGFAGLTYVVISVCEESTKNLKPFLFAQTALPNKQHFNESIEFDKQSDGRENEMESD